MDPQEKPLDRPLTRSDVWILTALLSAGGPVGLAGLIGAADYLDRAILTYDEVSFGVPRLSAAGLVEVSIAAGGAIILVATVEARSLVPAGRGVREVMTAMTGSLGARPYPEPEVEDRSLGRLPGLEPADMKAALAEHGAWRSKIPPRVWAKFDEVAAEQQGADGPTTHKKSAEKRMGEPVD